MQVPAYVRIFPTKIMITKKYCTFQPLPKIFTLKKLDNHDNA